MDPVTQAALGAAVTTAVLQRRLGRRAWRLGALSGMAADLDVLIRLPSDPLVALQYHRHFTHSLAFIPVGALLCALPWLLRRSEKDRRGVLAACTLGYATHALLDAFTSYGTLLWWPFSDTRVAWNVISIIDPLFTLPLLAGVILTVRKGRAPPPRPRSPSWAARIGLAFAALYMAICGAQRSRALQGQRAVMEFRGHDSVKWREVYPLFGVNSRWRSVYEHEGLLYADAFHTRWFEDSRWVPGGPTERLMTHDVPRPVARDERTAAAIEVFRWFSGDRLIGSTQGDAFRVCDTRYSADPEGFTPMFCVDLRPGHQTPVERPSMRPRKLGTAVEKFFPGVGEIPTRAVPAPRRRARN